jgi:hypothetical protein
VQAATHLSAGIALANSPPSARVSYCQPPEPASECGKQTVRWPEPIRVMMASTLLAALSKPEFAAVRETGIIPKCTAANGLKRVYAKIYDRAVDDLGLGETDQPAAKKPTVDAVRTTAQRWAVKLAQHGHVKDDPPHLPGYKDVGRRLEILEEIKASVVRGFPSANGHFYYGNVKEAIARDPQIGAWVDELDFKTPEAVWKLLKQKWPELYMGNLIMKKVRDHAQTVVRVPLSMHLICLQRTRQRPLHACQLFALDVAALHTCRQVCRVLTTCRLQGSRDVSPHRANN